MNAIAKSLVVYRSALHVEAVDIANHAPDGYLYKRIGYVDFIDDECIPVDTVNYFVQVEQVGGIDGAAFDIAVEGISVHDVVPSRSISRVFEVPQDGEGLPVDMANDEVLERVDEWTEDVAALLAYACHEEWDRRPWWSRDRAARAIAHALFSLSFRAACSRWAEQQREQ